MTVSTTLSRISYAGDGATTAFTFPFPAIDSDFIEVFLTDTFGIVTQAPSNTFSVTLNPPIDPNPTSIGGTVVYPLVGSPLALGTQIAIVRDLPATQSASISNQSIVYPPVIEQEFDYLTLLSQQGQAVRTFQVGPGDPTPALVPPVSQRANQTAFFDSVGNLTAGGTAGVVPISVAMQPVVAGATLTVARTAMGVAPIASPALTGTPTAPTQAPGDNDTSIATTAFVQQALGAVGGAVFTTGDLKQTHKTVADSGWILWTDGTIGDLLSGSTVRANADTSALFNLYYNSYSDATCPLKTSTGVATTRAAQGAAATAFAAHCRMTLPVGSGRAVGLAGSGSGLTSRALGSSFGSETHVQTFNELAQHDHNVTDPGHLHTIHLNNSINTGAQRAMTGDVAYTTDGFTELATTGISVDNSGLSTPMNIMNPTTYVNIMIKL